MKALRFAVLLLLASLAPAAWPVVEIEGVKFEDKTRLGADELVLNGAGQRSRLFLKVYAMGLYVTQKQTRADALLALKGPKRIHIVSLRDLTAEQFADALVEGVRKNHGEADLAALKPALDEFHAAVLGVKAAPKGTVIDIDFAPDSGTRLVVNQQPQGMAIPGEAFYAALLRIWLGERPAAQDLKEALLGKSGG